MADMKVFGVAVVLALLTIGVTAQRVIPDPTPAPVPEKLKGFVPVTDDMLQA
jgi:hypothetical protein